MSVVQSSVHSFLRMFEDKTQDFIHDIENVHMVWLEEIQQAANIMFSRDFNSEPELMPKTPSQKKNTRRKRVSVGRQEEGQVRRRFSKGRRSNLRGSSVTPLDIVVEEAIPNASAAKRSTSTRPNRTTRTKKQTKVEIAEDEQLQPHVSYDSIDECNKKADLVEDEAVHNNCEVDSTNIQPDVPCDARQSENKIPSPGVVVSILASERLSAEQATKPQPVQSPGRTAAKIAIAGNSRSSRRSSVKCSLKVRHSLGSLRHSMTRESLRRASRQSMLKKNATRKGNSSYSSNIDAASSCESMEEMDEVASEAVTANPEVAVTGGSDDSPQTTKSGQPSLARVTRSVAANSPKLAPPSLFTPERNYLQKRTMFTDTQQTLQASQRSTKNIKRQAAETTAESPVKRCTPPKRSRSAVRPNMKSFLHTVQKNQMLMMTQNSFNRNSVMKSFIKTTTPLKIDPKAKELQKLEALKKKQEQEEERMRKMEEEKKKKQEELKRKRDERLRKVYEAKVKEELREEEKKKKIEQKMAHIDEKNDKRQAAEMAKKRIAIKRQEDLEQKRKLEEETKRRKNQQAEEEKRQQEFLARKATEEELKAKKLAEARRALELKREQERERELERERVAAAESERVEKEKALALQRELARAAREKERLDLEEKRQKEEQQQRLAAEEKAAKDKEAAAKQVANAKTAAALNVTVEIERSVMSTPAAKGSSLNITVDIEKSPQSYSITPNGGSKTLTLTNNLENYGMDQNSDDSTDDESDPRKPIPSWAEGPKLQQIIMKQYFNPPDLDSFFGPIEPPKLENLFYKSKPRYFKRTSSAVWHSPPNVNKH
ncbi:inner centromere protein isoform X2 [Phycodurus eques]|uniref:inner centromere protein isoform X2 n=1 Tax=Phycodurus eques TaxID=693459 RepID=UPI002ACD4F25|nr:inner centromere protein isoform X2 [Phycodurus eques]